MIHLNLKNTNVLPAYIILLPVLEVAIQGQMLPVNPIRAVSSNYDRMHCSVSEDFLWVLDEVLGSDGAQSSAYVTLV